MIETQSAKTPKGGVGLKDYAKHQEALPSVACRKHIYLHAFLTSFDGSNITGNSTSNDDQIFLIC
jgi:hypothetical protein